jgi:uncharacterized repeat protein (TIGR01451 family)
LVGGLAVSGATVNGQTVTVPLGSLAAGASIVATFQAKVDPNAAGSATNVVSLGALGLQSAIVSNPAVAQVVPSTLTVTKTASASVVSAGGRVDYTIAVAPMTGTGFGATTIVDTLPDYELYASGTARVGGVALEPAVSGRTLTWKLPRLSASVTLSYAIAIANGAPGNQALTNTVDVTATPPGGEQPGIGHASAQVQVVPSTFGACYPITGRAYLDRSGSGRFEEGDQGLAGVTIFLDDGESVVTDAQGRYDFPCVRPGMHALRLDQTTLPAGVLPYPDRNIDSEKSTRRLVHRTFDDTIIEDVNFALTGKETNPARLRASRPGRMVGAARRRRGAHEARRRPCCPRRRVLPARADSSAAAPAALVPGKFPVYARLRRRIQNLRLLEVWHRLSLGAGKHRRARRRLLQGFADQRHPPGPRPLGGSRAGAVSGLSGDDLALCVGRVQHQRRRRLQ